MEVDGGGYEGDTETRDRDRDGDRDRVCAREGLSLGVGQIGNDKFLLIAVIISFQKISLLNFTSTLT